MTERPPRDHGRRDAITVTNNHGVVADTIVGPVSVNAAPAAPHVRPAPPADRGAPCPPAPGADEALEQLLCSMFDLEELLRFLRSTAGGRAIAASVPHASLQGLVSDTVAALHRHGLGGRVERWFFERLASERPSRRAEVVEVAELHGHALAPN